MTASAAFRDGIRRVNGAPLLLAGMCLFTLFLALPLSIALRGMIESHLGRSLVAEGVASGADYQWWQEFLSQATGLGSTFTPEMQRAWSQLYDAVQSKMVAAAQPIPPPGGSMG